MTMQVGIRAVDNSLVLASDTKWRVGEPSDSDSPVADTFVHRSKIAFAARHDIAVAMSGTGSLGDNPASDLAEFLAGQETIPKLSLLLEEWGNRLFKKQQMSDGMDQDDLKQLAFPLFTFLVVSPHSEVCFYKLRINLTSSTDLSNSFIVNGHENNPAIFWLEYIKANKPLSLDSATGIAAVTLLSGGEINPYGVGGLEIHQWTSGRWGHFTPKQIQATENRFAKFQKRLTQSACEMSVDRP